MDPAPGALDPDILHGDGVCRPAVRRGEQQRVGAVGGQRPDLGAVFGVRPAVPQRAVAPRDDAGHHAGRGRYCAEHAGCRVVAVHGRPGLVGVHQYHSEAVGGEAAVQVAVQVDVEFGERAGGEIPEPELVEAVTLVPDQHPLVARRRVRRPGRSGHARGCRPVPQSRRSSPPRTREAPGIGSPRARSGTRSISTRRWSARRARRPLRVRRPPRSRRCAPCAVECRRRRRSRRSPTSARSPLPPSNRAPPLATLRPHRRVRRRTADIARSRTRRRRYRRTTTATGRPPTACRARCRPGGRSR